MLLVFWVLLFLASACLFLLMPALWGRQIYMRYHGSRAVTCPENRQQVAVSFHAMRAAVTALSKRPILRLAECTRWPERENCGQQCIPQAIRSEAYQEHAIGKSRGKKIYHLPVLIGAFVAWIIGAIWHAQYLFRPNWMDALGLSSSELRQIVWWRAPHLLSLTVPLLFAYGVAWLLQVNGKRGVKWGLITSIAFWLAILVGSFVGIRTSGVATEVLKLEITYTFIASLVVGLIVGGLNGRLVETKFQDR